MADAYEFYNLGIGDPVPVSAASRLGIGDLLDRGGEAFYRRRPVRLRQKTTVRASPSWASRTWVSPPLINKLTGENRVIVSDIAGTTRDAIDTEVRRNGQRLRFH